MSRERGSFWSIWHFVKNSSPALHLSRPLRTRLWFLHLRARPLFSNKTLKTPLIIPRSESSLAPLEPAQLQAYALKLASLHFIIVAWHWQLNSSPQFYSNRRSRPTITSTNLHPDHKLLTHLRRQLNRSISPIIPSDPDWLFSLPPVNSSRLWLHSQPFKIFFQEIINSFENSIVCYTDGSKNQKRSHLLT